jgi:hypothetical protein
MCQVVATGLQRRKNVLISAFITFQEVFWFFLFQGSRENENRIILVLGWMNISLNRSAKRIGALSRETKTGLVTVFLLRV